jgi:leucyl-tRNA synthetase
VLQVNGKNRSRVTVPANAAEESVRELAMADAKIQAALEGKQILKVILVKGKLVNVVVKSN